MGAESESLVGVPTIDLTALVKNPKPDSEEYQKVIREIGQACEEWGFFYIINHGIDQSFIEKTTKLGMEFFLKPKEYKAKIARNETNFQGYSDSDFTKQKLDWKQLFDFSDPACETPDAPKLGVHGVNQWPDIPEFKETMLKYFEEMQNLSRLLMGAIIKNLTPGEGFVEKCFANNEDTSLCRLNYYPICPNPDTNLGVGPHADPGIVTVLLQDDTVTSLQVEKDGKFYNIPPKPNSYVINIGDMMQAFSNGKYKAPVHRVLANHTSGRFSLPYFLAPNYSVIVEPLNGTYDEKNPKKYRPIHWGHFRKARFEGDFADRGEEIQLKHFEI